MSNPNVIQNNWNKYHEHLLKKWSQMSKTYSIMHSLCAHYYANWHKRLGIPIILLGGITASSIFSSKKEDFPEWVYINGALALLMTALSGVSNFIGTAEKTSKHQNASYKYTKISMDIDTMLSFSRNERTQTPQEFISGRKIEMLEIRENAPEVLAWVMGDYLQKFEKSLTNTKSKINKNQSTSIYIPIQMDMGLGGTSNTESSPDSTPQDVLSTEKNSLVPYDNKALTEAHHGLPQVGEGLRDSMSLIYNQSPPDSGGILNDFNDFKSSAMIRAGSTLACNQSDDDDDSDQ